MNIQQLFLDKSIKTKAKASIIGEGLLSNKLTIIELLTFADNQKASGKASCIEAVEYATKRIPALADESLFTYVTKALLDTEPRIKWESAKVIGNVAIFFPTQLEESISNLLLNAENTGTVVRWATAYALAEILKLKTDYNKDLLPKLKNLCEKEEDNGVKKKYIDAFKSIKN